MAEINQTSSNSTMLDSDQTEPWLLISKGNNFQNHAFYSISKNMLVKRNVSHFHNRILSPTSYHGWVALFGAERRSPSRLDCCLLNTITREKIQLPSIHIDPESSWYYTCILSKPPTDPNCHIMLLTTSKEPPLHCRLGDEKFVSAIEGDDYVETSTNFGGKVYALMFYSHKIVEVDFVEGEIVLNELVNSAGEPLMIHRPTNRSKSYMVDCCGELLLVHMIFHWDTVELAYFKIFKINVLDKEVSELKSIGDRTIFLGLRESISIVCRPEDSSLKMNSIYYIYPNKFLHVYDIEDRSKTLIKLCPIKRHRLFTMCWVTM